MRYSREHRAQSERIAPPLVALLSFFFFLPFFLSFFLPFFLFSFFLFLFSVATETTAVVAVLFVGPVVSGGKPPSVLAAVGVSFFFLCWFFRSVVPVSFGGCLWVCFGGWSPWVFVAAGLFVGAFAFWFRFCVFVFLLFLRFVFLCFLFGWLVSWCFSLFLFFSFLAVPGRFLRLLFFVFCFFCFLSRGVGGFSGVVVAGLLVVLFLVFFFVFPCLPLVWVL